MGVVGMAFVHDAASMYFRTLKVTGFSALARGKGESDDNPSSVGNWVTR